MRRTYDVPRPGRVAVALGPLIAALVAAADPARAQVPVFTDVTSAVLSDNGSWGEGVAWGDFDGDGDLDLLVSNEGQRLVLYRNNGAIGFSILRDFGFGNWTGVACADMDNDGDLDFYAAQAHTPKRLYRNDGGGLFADVTAGDLIDDSHAHGVAWADVDLDGDVDLFYAVASPPDPPPGGGNRLMRNDGGTFTDITPASLDDPAYGRGCAFADVDLDGDPDLLVTNFGVSRLYRNDGGAFVDVTAPPVSAVGNAGGVAWGDADNDGDFDLAIAKAFGTTSKVYRNDGGFAFTDVTPAAAATADTAVAIAWIDVDNDGDLDLFIGAFAGNRLLRNDGGFAFTDVTSGPIGSDADAHGVAWGDFDGDGDLDVFFATYYGKPDLLLRNDTPGIGNALQIDLVGTQSNAAGIGARIEVVSGAVRQTRAVSAGEGYNSMNALRAHFGLGAAPAADSIVVHWPSGIVQDTANVAAGQRLTIVERDASLAVERPRPSAPTLRATPNPFAGAARVTFSLAARAAVRLEILDLQGRRVRALARDTRDAGDHTVAWDGRDASGRPVAPGVYVAHLRTPGAAARVRLVRE